MSSPPPHKRVLPHVDVSEQGLRELELWLQRRTPPVTPCDCPNPGSGDTVSGLILALGPDAFWKLNETTGSIAHDSSGNLHDLDPAASFSTATWGQEVAPTSDTSALFGSAIGFNANANVAMSAFTSNFTAGIWAKFSSLGSVNELIGQGAAAVHGVGGQHGWALAMNAAKLGIFTDGAVVLGDASLSTGTWYFFALVNDAGTWKMYVNGLLQSNTSGASISTGSTASWIGECTFSTGSFFDAGLLSYGFMVAHVVSGADLLAIYNAGISGGSVLADKVWTALGDGTADWEYPTIATFVNGV